MQQRPTPVVMFSAHTRQAPRDVRAPLRAGAVDFVPQARGEVSDDLVEDRRRS
jgi:chemotaxis response regulator CheB